MVGCGGQGTGGEGHTHRNVMVDLPPASWITGKASATPHGDVDHLERRDKKTAEGAAFGADDPGPDVPVRRPGGGLTSACT